MAEKKYYWLKFKKDFFNSKRIKKLRKLAGGDTYTIIYLKMQLHSLDKGGVLEYTGLEDTFAKELALDIDEDEDNVQITVNYLLSCGLLTTDENATEYDLPFVHENTGTETSAAERKRKSRENLLQNSNKSVTLSQGCHTDVTNCHTEIDIELESRDRVKSKTTFKKPTVSEVADYINEKGYTFSAEEFYDYYESNGWMVGKSKMKDYKAAIRNWARKQYRSGNNRDKFLDDINRLGAELYGK